MPALPQSGVERVNISLEPPATGVWDRISNWAAEHKGAVYTIAGVTLVVTAAGAVYYFSDSSPKLTPEEAAERKKARKQRKAAKKSGDKAEATSSEKSEAGALQESPRDG